MLLVPYLTLNFDILKSRRKHQDFYGHVRNFRSTSWNPIIIQLETDHKPLIPLLGTANLDSLPPSILRFRLRLSRFDYSISYIPGKYLYTADALSCAPLKTLTPELDSSETESFVQGVVANLPADSDHLEEYRKAQRSDPLTAKIIQFCQSQWPGRSRIENDLVHIGE